jgi:dihydroceramide fatty acyl 2-hydroxylase
MPKTRAGKLLRELHMRHHFQDDTRGFGISAPYWDTVFRTGLRRGQKQR